MQHFFLNVRTWSVVGLGLAPFLSWGQCNADLNGNATIDNDDLLILLADFGTSCDEAAWDDPVISEIHYNPSTQQGADSEFEFVELMNPHPFAIDLSGWALADGVDAAIPPGTVVEAGGFLLTVNDTATYQALLGPFVTLIPWSGTSSLHNSGETLRLLRPDGTEADVVTYSDTGDWTNEADGAGGSLEWKGPGWDNALPEAWIGSNALGGSPGTDNSSWAD
jgi:hypothetical protein